jgi:hypothetical protein
MFYLCAMLRLGVLLLFFTVLRTGGWAQGIPPIGQWREHLPFNNAIAVEVSGNFVHCATPYGYFGYDQDENAFLRRTKINGLSAVRVSGMTVEPGGGRVMLWYEDGNVDFLDGDQVINLPDIQQSTVAGDTRIFDALWRGNRVYLAAGLGIIVLDPDRNVVRDTWRPSSSGDDIRVHALAADNDFLYAATAEGVRRGPLSGNTLADFRNWQTISGSGLSAGSCEDVAIAGGRLVVRRQDTLFIQRGSTWDRRYSDGWRLLSMDMSSSEIMVGEALGGISRITVLDTAGQVLRRLQTPSLSLPREVARDGDTYWTADQNNGLLRIDNGAEARVFPNSPINTASGAMLVAGSSLWVAAGAVNDAWNYTFNPNGLYRFSNDFWTGINLYVYPQLDTLLDFVDVAKDPLSGKMYAGSFGGGLLEIDEGPRFRIFKQSSGLQEAIGDPGSYRVGGLAFDAEGNLWIANYGAPQNLVLRRPDGSWLRFGIPFLHTENALGQVIIDGFGYKWMQSPKGNGVFCFDDNRTPENISDDRWRYFRAGRGNGNLPSPEVYCLAQDRDGLIWVGTAQGIAVIQCLEDVFSATCDAVLPVVQQGNFAGFLFRDEQVRTIAVDGANRKWVGTRNGVWLISPDGQQVIARFTESNSPLLSNLVNRIAVDPATGEVFISTFNGICSFRGSATGASPAKDSVLVFPNPVPAGYSGTIAIRGLPEDAWVKITETDGRLVYQARALGGQAVWDGRNYLGQRASSGVYLVLVADRQNREHLAAKIFFIR